MVGIGRTFRGAPVGLGLVLLLFAACADESAPAADGAVEDAPSPSVIAPAEASAGPETPAPTPLPVDTVIAPAEAGADGWEYFLARETDLDGDGSAERVVVTARAAMINGRPAWDDGQPWQVYVETASGERTFLYRRFVQLGTVTMRLGMDEADEPSTIILIEHLPDRLALYEFAYRGPKKVEVLEHYERRLDPYGELASPMLPG